MDDQERLLMRVAIVGHGPSLLKNDLGASIDAADFVVRQKRSCMQYVRLHQECFGRKTNAIVGSFLIFNGMPTVPQAQYWIYTDSRLTQDPDKINKELSIIADYFRSNRQDVVIDKPLCDDWDNRYRELAKSMTTGDSLCKMAYIQDQGEHYHPHTSSGFKAILYTANRLKPEEIQLFGYDSMKSGEWTWSVTRGPHWNEYPNHAWRVERKLLEDVAKEYGFRYSFIG